MTLNTVQNCFFRNKFWQMTSILDCPIIWINFVAPRNPIISPHYIILHVSSSFPSMVGEGFSNEGYVVTAATALKLISAPEQPTNNYLEYLDLRINFPHGLRCCYGKMKPKPVLSINSSPSKSIKLSVVMGLLPNAEKELCVQNLSSSISHQLARLSDAHYY